MYAQALADKRRSEPKDDIMTALLEGEIDGEKLTEMDFNLFFLLLSVAGNETTRNAISHGMHALLQNPEQYKEMVQDPGLCTPATEEIVRWASPVMYFRRNVTQDTELRGQELKAGEKVTIYYISANRDEDIFDDPFTFDIHRDPNPHIGFGGGGPHTGRGPTWPARDPRALRELVRGHPTSFRRARPNACARTSSTASSTFPSSSGSTCLSLSRAFALWTRSRRRGSCAGGCSPISEPTSFASLQSLISSATSTSALGRSTIWRTRTSTSRRSRRRRG